MAEKTEEIEINPYTDEREVQTDDDKEFSAAFAESQKEKDIEDATEVTVDTEEVVDEATGTDAVAEDGTDAVVDDSEPAGGSDGDFTVEDEGTTTSPLAESGPEVADKDDGNIEATIDFQSTIEQLQAEIAALKESRTRPEQAEPQAGSQEAPPLYSDEEEKILKQYAEDWGDVQKGEALTRRKEYHQLVKYIFDQVHEVYGPSLDYVQSRSGKDQYSEIKTLVEDYDTVRDNAIAWAEKQPTYLKAAYQEVIKNGTPEEVADFITRYKQETGYAKTAPATNAPVVTEVKKATTDPKKVAAAAALKVVDTRRSQTTSEPDNEDFSTAFKEFASMR